MEAGKEGSRCGSTVHGNGRTGSPQEMFNWSELGARYQRGVCGWIVFHCLPATPREAANVPKGRCMSPDVT